MSYNDLSFGLIRTNPRLSGNVKITIDSNQDLYLDSIDANPELSNFLFKKYKINSTGFYPYDVFKFFGQGSIQSNIIFDTYQTGINKGGKKDLSSQYDMFYTYGASQLSSKFYDEDIALFAPLWMKKELPKYFVIYKVPGPVSINSLENVPSGSLSDGIRYKVYGSPTFTVTYNGTTYKNGELFTANSGITTYSSNSILDTNKVIEFNETKNVDKILDPTLLFDTVLKDAQLIKTFDLRETSKLGQYLRNIKNNAQYPNSPLEVNFGNNNLTLWKGISVKDGSFASKGDYLNEYFTTDKNQIDFEDFFTNGFEKNGLICANLMNLEFLFTDETSENWDINRYFGFYVDDIPTGSFQIDNIKLKTLSSTIGQTPTPKPFINIDLKFDGSFVQNNPNGINIWTSNVDGDLPDYADLSQPEFWFIKDKNNNFHNIKPNTTTTDNVIKITDTKLDIGNLTGFGNIILNEKAFKLNNSGRANIILDVQDVFEGFVDTNSFGDYIELIMGSTTLRVMANPVPGWVPSQTADVFEKIDPLLIPSDWPPILADTNTYLNWFHPGSTKEETAKGIANALNVWNLRTFDCYVIGTKIYLITKSLGLSGNSWFVELSNPTKITSNNTENKFLGGTSTKNSRVKIESLEPILNDTFVKTSKDWAKIKSTSPYLDEPVFENGVFQYFKDIDRYQVVSIDDDTETILINQSNKLVGYELWRNTLGIFSLYPIKDFDFDFHSSIHKLQLLETQKYFSLKPDTEGILIPNSVYIVEGSGSINYNEGVYSNGNEFSIIPEVTSFTILNGTPTVRLKEFSKESVLNQFLGFNTLLNKFNTDTNFTNYNDKFLVGTLKNEYDLLQENTNKDLVLKSRVVPTITKWAYTNGTDIRNNPYRLNILDAFGQFNFTPSYVNKTPDSLKYTHEWYYIDNLPISLDKNDLLNNKLYFEYGIDKNQLSNINSDYFSDYFRISEVNGIQIHPQERWTNFNYNNKSGFAETLFKGAKLRIKKLKDSKTKDIIKDVPTFDNYKFSVVLTSKKRNETIIEAPISYEVIENKKWKTITIVITTIIEDYRFTTDFSTSNFKAELDYLGLYTLIDKKKLQLLGSGYDNAINDDVWLNFGLNLDVPSFYSSIDNKNYIEVINNINWPVNAYDDIIKNQLSGTYNNFVIPNLYYVLGRDWIYMNMSDILNINTLVFNQIDNTSGEMFPTFPASSVFIPNGNANKWMTNPVKYLNGGYNYYKEFINKLSFSFIKDMVNSNNKLITYKSYDESGVSINSDFILEFLEPDVLKRKTSLIPSDDIDKPSELKLINNIGTVVTSKTEDVTLIRHSGSYEPIFKDTFFFKDKTNYEGLRTTFNLLSDFGKLKNFYYYKVSNTDIMKLSKNSKYDSVYPAINETPLDKKDFYIWQSNWDNGYYQFYSNNINYLLQSGTRQMVEQKSFMASKVMKTPEKITINTFKSKQVPSLDSFDESNLGDSEAVWSIDSVSNTIKLRVYSAKSIIRWMIENGADKEFLKNLLPEFSSGDLSSINDDVEQYLTSNILSIFDISNIDFYVKTFKVGNFQPVESNFNTIQKIQNGYIKKDTFNKNSLSKFVFEINYPLDSSTNTSISIDFSITRI